MTMFMARQLFLSLIKHMLLINLLTQVELFINLLFFRVITGA